jgi:hypothetical protein
MGRGIFSGANAKTFGAILTLAAVGGVMVGLGTWAFFAHDRTTHSARPNDTAIVEVDVFSGRANPNWRLSSGETKELLQLLESIDLRVKPSTPVDVLGYRGFLVAVTIKGAQHTIRIFDNSVQPATSDRAGQIRGGDDGRVIEQWLYEHSRGHLDDAVRVVIADDLKRHRL